MDRTILLIIALMVAFYLYTYGVPKCLLLSENFRETDAASLDRSAMAPTVSKWVENAPKVTEFKVSVDTASDSSCKKDDMSWTEKFKRAENLTNQENMINVGGSQESFFSNELPCSKRWMSLDIRKSPVINIVPSFTPWNQTVIHPSCIAQDQTRPSLDD